MAEEWGGILFVYLYDAEGSPIGMQIRSSNMAEDVFYTFWFEKNLQGDVVAVYTDSGTKIIAYVYDAWGNATVTSWNAVGTRYYARYNPFRYRGYYYDTETGFYYLNSRYYDPATGRFINADGYVSTETGFIGYNMFAYCNNNPVMGIDPTGKWTFSFGFSFYLALPGGGYSGNIVLSCDSEEMLAVQYSYSFPSSKNTRNTAFGATASAGVTMQITSSDSVDDLNGKSKSVGINTPIIGVDAILDNSMDVVGVSVGIGPSVGGDVHVNETYTKTIGKQFKSLLKWVKDKIGI